VEVVPLVFFPLSFSIKASPLKKYPKKIDQINKW